MEFFCHHGKNACDRVGGTIKRLATHTSLQHPFSNQILTPKQLFDFAEANVDGITSFFMSSEEIVTICYIKHTKRNMESPSIHSQHFKPKSYIEEDIICN